MKIALLGYGKMGQVIEKIALQRGHEIVVRKSIGDSFNGLENATVAIDFSAPDAAIENISTALKLGIPIISGTTGWLQDYDKMVQLCQEKNGAFISSSNFSLGVNIFFELNTFLARIMSKFEDYKIGIEEIHHTQKLDAPSGTAISLAKGVIENSDYKNWTMENPKSDDILIEAKRIENVPGTHTVTYNSNIDLLEIKHLAHNREGFALGAVIASEWIVGKQGVFTMKDVLELNLEIR
jgi:4-hydroxy-tetrahydrodipicolinate reductase